MPRRVYTYQAGLGWGTANMIATVGGFLFGFGTLLTVVNVVWSRRHGEMAGPNPWERRQPRVGDAVADPGVELRPTIPLRHRVVTRCGTGRSWPTAPTATAEDPTSATRCSALEGARADRETPMTSGLATEPEGVLRIPQPSLRPVRGRARGWPPSSSGCWCGPRWSWCSAS